MSTKAKIDPLRDELLNLQKRMNLAIKPRPIDEHLAHYWQAPGGGGPLAFAWGDKPYRLLYNLIAHILHIEARGPDVAVKTLEWSSHPAGGQQAIGAGLLLYRIHPDGDNWYLGHDHMGIGGTAAVQADFERRIRSSIVVTPPAPAPDRDAISRIINGIYGLGYGDFAGGHQDKSIERAVEAIFKRFTAPAPDEIERLRQKDLRRQEPTEAASIPTPPTGGVLAALDMKGFEVSAIGGKPLSNMPEGEPIKFVYTNYRGETGLRTIVPKNIWFGSTEWHPQPQWLLRAYDVEKKAERDFALKDFAAHPSGEVKPRKGFAMVPLRLTREMNQVMEEEDWQWEDLLAAAEAITEEQYDLIASGSSDEVERLQAALEPFAKIADLYHDREDDETQIWIDHDQPEIRRLTVGDCRRAKQASNELADRGDLND